MIHLRKFVMQDMGLFTEWLHKPHVLNWYHEPEEWLAEVQNENGEYDWIEHLIVEYDGKPIGFCQYYEYVLGGETWHGSTELKGTYSLDYLIGEEEYLGKGIGKQMVTALVENIRIQTPAERIIVQPEPENLASCNTLLGCGFTYDQDNALYGMELMS